MNLLFLCGSQSVSVGLRRFSDASVAQQLLRSTLLCHPEKLNGPAALTPSTPRRRTHTHLTRIQHSVTMSSALPRRSARIAARSFAAKLASPPTLVPRWWDALSDTMVEPCDYESPRHRHCEVTVVTTYNDGEQMTWRGALPLKGAWQFQFHIGEVYHPTSDCIHATVISLKLMDAK